MATWQSLAFLAENRRFLKKAAPKTLALGAATLSGSETQILKFFGYLSFKKGRVLKKRNRRFFEKLRAQRARRT
ncbi:MAG: hypothetical protein IJP07_01275, partial [Firmicutes bacterium]|nr:hypothetical protein [Bacillota bacterium]